jgi:alpha-N-acetylglucosamine transferase
VQFGSYKVQKCSTIAKNKLPFKTLFYMFYHLKLFSQLFYYTLLIFLFNKIIFEREVDALFAKRVGYPLGVAPNSDPFLPMVLACIGCKWPHQVVAPTKASKPPSESSFFDAK